MLKICFFNLNDFFKPKKKIKFVFNRQLFQNLLCNLWNDAFSVTDNRLGNCKKWIFIFQNLFNFRVEMSKNSAFKYLTFFRFFKILICFHSTPYLSQDKISNNFVEWFYIHAEYHPVVTKACTTYGLRAQCGPKNFLIWPDNPKFCLFEKHPLYV